MKLSTIFAAIIIYTSTSTACQCINVLNEMPLVDVEATETCCFRLGGIMDGDDCAESSLSRFLIIMMKFRLCCNLFTIDNVRLSGVCLSGLEVRADLGEIDIAGGEAVSVEAQSDAA
ncbi:hypothetical protein R3P38DRAFT_3010686 [Favolaschia claudopus]|uniref:Uncharacterized protein n=1 Tax=Favolaschia claudopus TaxID=2862362 RepID=A0AAW0AJL2_9AGAR